MEFRLFPIFFPALAPFPALTRALCRRWNIWASSHYACKQAASLGRACRLGPCVQWQKWRGH